jgi:hypothetical protein
MWAGDATTSNRNGVAKGGCRSFRLVGRGTLVDIAAWKRDRLRSGA